MQLMHIESLEVVGPVTVLSGTVQNETLSVGQSLHLTSRDNRRETVTIVGITPKDYAAPGTVVKVLIRRTDPTFDVAPGMSLRKITAR